LSSDFFSPLNRLNRRDFLKFSSLGFLTLALPQFPVSARNEIPSSGTNPLLTAHRLTLDRFPVTDQIQDFFGRITQSETGLYEKPSFSSKLIKTLWTDVLMPITDVTVGDQEPDYNRVWYDLDGQGYVHSGSVQPVQVKSNQPDTQIPSSGCLAEVTVPYTDGRWWASSEVAVAYRFYYATTHWVTGYTTDETGLALYRVYDNLIKRSYFVQASHLRLIPPTELQPLSPNIPAGDKRIEVHLAEQMVIAYERDEPVFMARAATGGKFSNGNYSTPTGLLPILYKSPTHHMASNNLAAANSYDLPGVPWICYITEDGLGFHGTFWHNDFGKPRSHGCINLTPQSARWIYLWTTPVVPTDKNLWFDEGGTSVNII
jgi:lipoprotein-anchoring transpeptidase ErfK/SrfK